MAQNATWPELAVDSWTETRETLHMWLQIVGKIQEVSTPLINHWWNVTYEVSARGLRSRLMHSGDRGFDAEFDFVDHQLVLRSAQGGTRSIALEPRTVADFYAATLSALEALNLNCVIVASPNEVAPAVPFAQDTVHKSYDAQAVTTYWRQLLAINTVFEQWRGGFAGKVSPVQLFWGSMDLSCVRYSGRVAPAWNGTPPPSCPAWVMVEAESHETRAPGSGQAALKRARSTPTATRLRMATRRARSALATSTRAWASGSCPTPTSGPALTRRRPCWRS